MYTQDKIAGELDIPSNRVIKCKSGVTFYQRANSNLPNTFAMSWNGSPVNNVGISGCTFAGQDTPTGSNSGAYTFMRGLYMYKNTMIVSSFGQLTFLEGYHNVGDFLTCLGNPGATSGNGSGCWAVQNTPQWMRL